MFESKFELLHIIWQSLLNAFPLFQRANLPQQKKVLSAKINGQALLGVHTLS